MVAAVSLTYPQMVYSPLSHPQTRCLISEEAAAFELFRGYMYIILAARIPV